MNSLILHRLTGEKSGLYLLLFLSLLLVSSGSGCSGDSGAREISVGISLEPKTLNPILDLNNEARQITSLVFDGLTNPIGLSGNLRQEYEYALAQKIAETDPRDRRFLRVELRPGIKWHNNVDFTAGDVLFTWEAIHQSNSPLRVRLDRFVDDIRVVDDLTLTIRLREERIAERVKDILSFKILPQVYDPSAGASGHLPRNLNTQSPIVSRFNWKPVGTGPYQVSERPASSEIFLSANPLPVLGAPKVQKVQLKRFPGWDVITKALAEKNINLAVDVPPDYFAQLDRENLANQVYSPYNFYVLVYNVSSPPLNSRRFRRALTQTVNREQLAATFLPDEPNVAQFINESIYPYNYEHVQDNPEAFRTRLTTNPAAAKRALRDFSASSKKIRLLYCSLINGENANLLAQSYKQMLSAVGVEVILENAPNIAIYHSRLRSREFQVAFVLYDGLDHFYELYDFFEPDGKKKHSGFVHPRLTNLLAELKLTLAFDDVGRLSAEIHRIIDRHAPVCPLFTLPKRAYYSPNLQDLMINPEYYFNQLYLADFYQGD
ncbi:MAG: ABC transporter substrate-binding protein [bacterium]